MGSSSGLVDSETPPRSCILGARSIPAMLYLLPLDVNFIYYTRATIVDMPICIALASDYNQPATASASSVETENNNGGAAESAAPKTEDVVSSMLARGFILGKDAVNRAKSFDEKHQFTSTATAKVVSVAPVHLLALLCAVIYYQVINFFEQI